MLFSQTLPFDFETKLERVTESGCWLWIGCLHRNGYGHYYEKPRKQQWLAHRFAYQFFKGSIPKELQLDHLCRVRCCVNPEHLEAVTRKENILRGESPPAKCARRTHCKQGHALAGNNLLNDGRSRRCLTCRMIYEYQRNLRRYTPKFHRIARNVKTNRSLIEVHQRRAQFLAYSKAGE